jgi:hypothetical protein
VRLKKLKYKPVELYESINEVIQYNWEQLSLTGDPKWLVKDDKNRDEKINEERFKELFFKLHDEFSDLTGGSEIMEKWSILMIQRMEARVLYLNGDRSQINLVNLYTAMIDELMSGSEDVNIIKSRMIIQRAYGQAINPRDYTVPEYQAIVEIVREQNQSKPNGENRA